MVLQELKKTSKSRKCYFRSKGKALGSGAYGRARMAYKRHSKDKSPYVVKEFFKPSHVSKRVLHHRIRHEYTITRRARHPNVVSVVDLCTKQGDLGYVMEYCDQGDLGDLINKRVLPSQEQLCLFKQLLRGVANLHSQGTAHLDIKPENLLITSDSVLKIADFGACHVFRDPNMGPKHFVKCTGGDLFGTLAYLPPEVFYHGIEYDPRKVDVWCCANVALSMLGMPFPWESATENDTVYKLFVESWRTFMRVDPTRAIDGNNYPDCGGLTDLTRYPCIQMMVLLLKMLNPNPRNRITIHQALNDPFVKDVECCSLTYYPTGPHPRPIIQHDHRIVSGSEDSTRHVDAPLSAVNR
ncbi:putative serine/threonine protein kinase [Aspergillus ibericus CBS 121593]|uniref:Autophagy-related protein 1 n=1 Tax=Aspergillus ibericus CBS 121593 TaxID=1448316 RepID=A0A395HG17_9EURO|nr:kinase-like protein [Aspergillus ibericus CBS 121593]RAL06075.1 kinase-like protein [Aspergillus ibericus CBS 121593]